LGNGIAAVVQIERKRELFTGQLPTKKAAEISGLKSGCRQAIALTLMI
jgi:hypothetical protein